MSIGANILAPWVNDRARMFDYLVRLNPQMVVVCDEPSVAAAIKSALPNTTVIHRWVVDGDGSHTNWSPDAWVRSFALQLPPGVMGYLLNEPGGNWRELSAYLVSVMSLCAALNIPLCVGNFSKGNPPQAALNAGELDALLLAFNDFPLHRLGYHPYWATDPDEDEHAQWHIHIQRRAAQIGARVKLFATESGRDVSGAYSDGYRAHMSNATYAEKEVRHARVLHAAGIDQAPYAYGKGGPETVNGVERFKWEQFDHQNNAEAQAAFLDFNAKVRNTATMPIIEPPKPGTPAVTGQLAALPASYTYRFVRALPDITSEQTGVITLQEPAEYYPGDVRNGWMYVRSRQTPEERGWMYQQGVTFLPDQPPASRPVTLTRAEYTQILSILTDAEKRQGENP